jgi:hypothetical protein
MTTPALIPAPTLDGRLHQLIVKWRAEYDAVSTTDVNASETHMARLYAIEHEAAAIRPVTVEGLAIKLLILTNYGEFDLDGPGSGLLPEAEEIAGYSPPSTFRRS